MKLAIVEGVPMDVTKETNSSEISFDIKMYSDILLPGNVLPDTLEESLTLMKQLPSLIEKLNGGKGIPLQYWLLPLTLLEKKLKLCVNHFLTLHTVISSRLIEVVKLFQELLHAKQKLNDFLESAIEYESCLQKEELADIHKFYEGLENHEIKSRSSLALIVVRVRSGECDTAELDSLVKYFYDNEYSPVNIAAKFEEWKEIAGKIFAKRYFEKFAKLNVNSDVSLNEEILLDMWKRHESAFFQELGKKKNLTCCSIDCDMRPNPAQQGKLEMQEVTNGQVGVRNSRLDSENRSNIVSKKALTWVEGNRGVLPQNAVIAGYENDSPVCVARAEHDGGLVPGKVHHGGSTCYIPYGFKEHYKKQYEILKISDSNSVSWKQVNNGIVPESAVVGGRDPNGDSYFICKVTHSGATCVGKVHKGRASISFGGDELFFKNYEVLVFNQEKD